MIDEKLKRDVANGDIKAVRRDLLGIINSDPGLEGGEFKESLNYAARELGAEKLYEDSLEEFQYKTNPYEWDKDYDAGIFLALNKCFSEKLIEHLQEVAPVVYGKKRGQSNPLVQTEQPPLQGINPVLIGVCIMVLILLVLVFLI